MSGDANSGIIIGILATAPSAREAIGRILRRLAADYTDPAHPPGCLVITAAVNCSAASADVEQGPRAARRTTTKSLIDRIAVDVGRGVLPADTDATQLGHFYAAVIQGMSTQARDGATHSMLDGIVDLALAAWPPAPQSPPCGTRR